MQLYANPLGCFGSCRLTSFVVEIVEIVVVKLNFLSCEHALLSHHVKQLNC